MRLPQQLQRAMAAEAEAAREARAKVIAAEGEHKSSRALAHAAEVIAQSPAALQVILAFCSAEAAVAIWLHCCDTMQNCCDTMQNISYFSCLRCLATLPSNAKQHFGGEEQYHCLPRPNRHHFPAHQRPKAER